MSCSMKMWEMLTSVSLLCLCGKGTQEVDRFLGK